MRKCERTGQIRHSCKTLVGKPEGKNLGDLSLDVAKIKMEITQTGLQREPDSSGSKLKSVVNLLNKVMYLRFH